MTIKVLLFSSIFFYYQELCKYKKPARYSNMRERQEKATAYVTMTTKGFYFVLLFSNFQELRKYKIDIHLYSNLDENG